MKTTNQILSAVVALAVIATVAFLALGVAGPAFSTARLTALVAQPTPPPGEVIPLEPIAGLTSLNATVKLDVNGLDQRQARTGRPERSVDDE